MPDKTYTVRIVQTRTFECPIEANNALSALSLVKQEWLDNSTNLSNDDAIKIHTEISCNGIITIVEQNLDE